MGADSRVALSLIVAMARNRVIGRDGALPWHEPEDLRHFQRLSAGHALIMGRRTADSLKRPLPRRHNLVVSRQAGLVLPGFTVYPTFDAALAAAAVLDPEPMVIGGAEIYRLALPRATILYLTEIQRDYVGDTLFPPLDERDWRTSERRQSGELVFRTLVRSSPSIDLPKQPG